MSLKQKALVLSGVAMVAVFVVFVMDYLFMRTEGSAGSIPLFSMLAAEVILLGWGVFLIRSSFAPLGSAMRGLTAVGKGVEDSSSHAHETSLSLADGAANQASSLEETSASLEEITAMTVHNAQNADQGQALMLEVQGFVNRAGESMGGMKKAMGEISEASQHIGKIIKKIDEISFQTNLLALNAAVEAARAGEHGAGFAVVAGEVRNLSQRAAEAARESQELIKNALVKVQGGVDLVFQTEGNFAAMVEASTKETILVQEIAQGSKEQESALEQISKAMSQIDMATQNSSAQASESARVSEQMEHSTQQLRQAISALSTILEGGNERKDAMNLVKRAVAMAGKKGLNATIRAIQDKNGPFKSGKDTYVYAGSTEIVTLLAHPVMPEKLVGPDLSNWPDKRGKLFFNDLVDVARSKGEGWVDYWWPKPGETTPSLKSTYVLKVPHENAYFACGIYS